MRALLLSGGIDSAALAFWLRPDVAVTVDYGQKPAPAEIQAASAICDALELQHVLIHADCSALGSGSMAGKRPSTLASEPEWWPYRNQFLVTLAAMRLVTAGIREILIGTVRGDSVHGDGKPEFVDRLSALMQCQEGGIRVAAPAIHLTSEELLQLSGITRDILGWTFSCHVSEFACGECRGCVKHGQVFQSLDESLGR